MKRHRPIRLKGFDYAQSGAYFVTICAYESDCLFGEVVEAEMRVNKIGSICKERMVEDGRNSTKCCD